MSNGDFFMMAKLSNNNGIFFNTHFVLYYTCIIQDYL